MQMLGVNVIVMMMRVLIALARCLAHDDPQSVELLWNVARASTITAAARSVLSRRCTLRQHAQEGGSRWCGKLPGSRRAVTHAEPLEQAYRRRRRNRQ